MDDLTQNTRAFAAALKRDDVVGAAAAYADDALLQPPGAEAIEGRLQIAAFWRAGLDAGIRDVEFTAVTERRQDGVAFEIGRYVLRLDTVEGGSVVDRGRYLLVHQRQADGSWRFAVEMLSPDQAPGGQDR